MTGAQLKPADYDIEGLALDAASEIALYHPASLSSDARPNWVSILVADDAGKLKPYYYKRTELAQAIRRLPSDRDVYIQQSSSWRRSRLKADIKEIRVVFSDLDYYNISEFAELPAEQMAALLDNFFCDNQFPKPSVIIGSGKGLQIKWCLDAPLPARKLIVWDDLQSRICKMLMEFGADPRALDAARVLRVVGTTSSKNNSVVRVVGGTGKPVEFAWLCEQFHDLDDGRDSDHPYSQQAKDKMARDRKRREKNGFKSVIGSKPTASRFTKGTLNRARAADLRVLYKLRKGKTEGWSMPLLFWTLNFLALSGSILPSDFNERAEELCREFGLGELERDDELKTLLNKVKEHIGGKTVTWQGREYPPIYTPKNETLIDIFAITLDEQRQLGTIISAKVKRERDCARDMRRRRKAGQVERKEYLSRNDVAKQKATKMLEAGMSKKQIAEALGVSKSTIKHWLR